MDSGQTGRRGTTIPTDVLGVLWVMTSTLSCGFLLAAGTTFSGEERSLMGHISGLTALLLMNLRVISSHSSGSSISRNPMQMMMVAPNLTTLKIILCFNRSTAVKKIQQCHQNGGRMVYSIRLSMAQLRNLPLAMWLSILYSDQLLDYREHF